MIGTEGAATSGDRMAREILATAWIRWVAHLLKINTVKRRFPAQSCIWDQLTSVRAYCRHSEHVARADSGC